MIIMKTNLKKHVKSKKKFLRFIKLTLLFFIRAAFAILKEMEAQKATEAARAKEDIRAASKINQKKISLFYI